MAKQATKKKAEGARFDPILGEMPSDLAALDGAEEGGGEKLPTLAERGRVLPIGFLDHNGVRHQEFDLAEWNWETEEVLGELAEDNPDMPMNQYVSEIIGHGVTRIGSVDLSKMKRSQRRLLARSLYFSDALYIYIWIRIGALGHGLKLERFRCASCRRWVENFVGDLRTLEVKAFDEVPSRRVELSHGVEYAGKRLNAFTVGPLRWAFMETDDVGIFTNPAKFRLGTLQQSVTGLEGAPEGPVYLTSEHLRTMKPVEVNELMMEIDQCNGGAVMEIADRCPRCRDSFRRDINWSYEDFFAPSSH